MSVFAILIRKPPAPPPIPEFFGLQLKEQQRVSGYAANIAYSWDGDNQRLVGYTNAASIATGVVFVSMPKSILNGNKIRMDWEFANGYTNWEKNLNVVDGKYDRTSLVDFPHSVPLELGFVPKGSGILFDYSRIGIVTRETYTTSVLDLSSSVLDDVTIMVRFDDNHNTYAGYLYIYNLEILSSSDEVLSTMEKNAVVNVVSDTWWDYGTYGNWNIFYS